MGPISYKFLKHIVKTDADIIYATSTPYLHMVYPFIGRHLTKRSIPYIYQGALHIDKNCDTNKYILQSIIHADAYVANTEYEIHYLQRYGLSETKSHVISPGIDTSIFRITNREQTRQKLGIAGDPLVVFIGRISQYKGIDTLLMAMQEVWKKHPDTYLLIAGARTDFYGEIEKILALLKSEQRSKVTLITNISEKEKIEYLSAADIFVSVSKEESFGIVYLEAWACETAVIGASVGAVMNVIEDGVDGLLVSYGDKYKLADLIITLIKDPEYRNRLANCGYDKVEESYTMDRKLNLLRIFFIAQLKSAGSRSSLDVWDLWGFLL